MQNSVHPWNFGQNLSYPHPLNFQPVYPIPECTQLSFWVVMLFCLIRLILWNEKNECNYVFKIECFLWHIWFKFLILKLYFSKLKGSSMNANWFLWKTCKFYWKSKSFFNWVVHCTSPTLYMIRVRPSLLKLESEIGNSGKTDREGLGTRQAATEWFLMSGQV